MKSIPLGNIADIKTGKLDVNAGAENGKYPFFTCASTPYKVNEYAFDTEAVLIAGNGDLNVKYYKGKFNAYQRTYVIQNKDNDSLSMRYLYYFICKNS
ncbi:MAG: restriction endonuclease subunit S [Nitrosomonas sp.]|nr:restriction endonuclease subunit S [Nitrosomonas sp.]